MPDYTTLCLDCHSQSIPLFGDPYGRTEIVEIDWGNHKHGGKASNFDEGGHSNGRLLAPYSKRAGWENTNFVLSCLDCHEPHAGKKASYMLRRFVNGQAVDPEPKSGFLCWVESTQSQHYYDKFCINCHYDFPEETVSWHTETGLCKSCHSHASGTSDYGGF